MSEHQFNIQHGQFNDVVGRSQRVGDVTFIPARITLLGTSFDWVFALKDRMDEAPAEVRMQVRPGEDAPWVLGRLIRLFDTEVVPADERTEKSCLYASFLAVLHDRDYLAVPFECTDYYGESALTFSSDDEPPDDLQEAIALKFWELLLGDPADVADYEDKMLHSGEGGWVRFGVANGEPFMVEDDNG